MGLFDYADYERPGYVSAGAATDYVFLKDLSAADWKKILSHAEIMHFGAGQVLIQAGEVDNSFYVLSEGQVEVVLPDFGDVLATIQEGAVFGEMAFFDSLPRSATVRSRTAGAAIRLSRDGFTRLSGWDPALARTIIFDLGKVLTLRLRASNARFRS